MARISESHQNALREVEGLKRHNQVLLARVSKTEASLNQARADLEAAKTVASNANAEVTKVRGEVQQIIGKLVEERKEWVRKRIELERKIDSLINQRTDVESKLRDALASKPSVVDAILTRVRGVTKEVR
jgi:chromosome segregation ATPase